MKELLLGITSSPMVILFFSMRPILLITTINDLCTLIKLSLGEISSRDLKPCKVNIQLLN